MVIMGLEGVIHSDSLNVLSTLSLIGLKAYYLILWSTEHQKAYVLLKYVPYKNAHTNHPKVSG